MPHYNYVFATFTMEHCAVRVEVQLKAGDRTEPKDIRKKCFELPLTTSTRRPRFLAEALERWMEMAYPDREVLVETRYGDGDGYIAANVWEEQE